eukprot:gene8655-10156_t
MEELDNIEVVSHILFDIKNKSSLSKSVDTDFVPASPNTSFHINSSGGITSNHHHHKTPMRSPRAHRSNSASLSPSTSFNLFENNNNQHQDSSSSSDPRDHQQPMSPREHLSISFAKHFSSNMFYTPSSSLAFSSLPTPSPLGRTSPNSLASSTDSLGGSTDAIINQCSLISLSSSPSQSVPSSPPPSKSHKFHNSFTKQPSSPRSISRPMSPLLSSSPSSPSSPVSTLVICNLTDCLLCQRGQPELLIKSPTWASIMRVVFFTLHNEMRDKQFFSLKTDVYEFMTTHWDVLCLNKKRSENWHKQIQDMLSHSKNIFESGMDTYKQNGFWRLKYVVDPWTLQKGGRKNSSLSLLSLSSSPLSSSPLSSSPLAGSSSSQMASLATSPRASSISIPNLNTSPLILSNSGNTLFMDEIRKRSSIDMLLTTSLEGLDNMELNSPRKRRLSDAAATECVRSYSEESSEELYIDDSASGESKC